MQVETVMQNAFLIEGELDNLLKEKATMKLKFELTSLLLEIQARTGPARIILSKFFDENNIRADKDGNVLIQRFENGNGKESEVWKQFVDLNTEKLNFEHNGITRELLEQVESTSSCTNLIKFLTDNNLIK